MLFRKEKNPVVEHSDTQPVSTKPFKIHSMVMEKDLYFGLDLDFNSDEGEEEIKDVN